MLSDSLHYLVARCGSSGLNTFSEAQCWIATSSTAPAAEEAKNAGNVSFPQLHIATFSLITILQELFKTGNWEEAYNKCDIEYLLTHCQIHRFAWYRYGEAIEAAVS